MPYSARAAARVSRTLDARTVAYVSNFENEPAAVTRLAHGRTLLGNSPEVLRRARNPALLAQLLAARGFVVPAIRTSAPLSAARKWVRKPRRSGGGHGVRRWTGSPPLGRGEILQERIDGVPASIVFVSDGRRAVPLALTRQLVGERAFGARGHLYCGNILAPAHDAMFARAGELLVTAVALARAATEALALVGVNGIDVIARDGAAWPLELNPRWTASMELAERAFDISVFDAHARACAGRVPRFALGPALARLDGAVGKAIVYARRDVVAPDTRPWLDDPTVRDVPHPGERIARGRPICTIFARGGTGAECHAALVRRAGALYEVLERGFPRRVA